MYEEAFRARLTALRMQKSVSEREMSLSMGKSNSYINKIANGTALPSMKEFFSICEYLEVTPAEFFSVENHSPERLNRLAELLMRLDEEKQQALLVLLSGLGSE